MEFIKNILEKWGFSSLIGSFVDHEFNEEAFRALNYEALKEIIPKAGPRLLFWEKFKSEFQRDETESAISAATTVSNSSAFTVSSNDLNESFSTGNFSNILSGCLHETEADRTLTDVSLNGFLKDSAVDSPVLVANSNLSTPVYRQQSFYIIPSDTKSVKDTIEEYLKCPNGTILKQYYNTNKFLNESNRNKLASVLIHREVGVSENPKISTDRFVELSKAIVELFPNENPATYYIKYNNVSKRLASGKLWETYNHLKRRLRTNSSHKLEEISTHDHEELLKEKLNYLQSHLDDESLIKNYWDETRNYRLQLIKSNGYEIDKYFAQFLCLNSQLGAQLLMTDFNVMYPNVQNLFISWEKVNTKLIKYGTQHRIMATGYVKDDSILAGLVILSMIFKSSIYMKKGSSGKRTRLSGAEILNSFLCLVPGLSELNEIKNRTKDKLRKSGQKFQPAVFLVGANYDDIQSSYVFVNDNLFNFEGPLEAIDACFKLINAVHAKYSEACEPIWLFLQTYVYQFTTEWDKSYTKLSSLTSDLNNF